MSLPPTSVRPRVRVDVPWDSTHSAQYRLRFGGCGVPEQLDALLIYANPYYNQRQHAPFGLDCLATYLQKSGLSSETVFPFLYARPLSEIVDGWARLFRPSAIGINIRNIDPYIPTDPVGEIFGGDVQSRWFLPDIAQLVQEIRRRFPSTPLILGGSGYSMSPGSISSFVGCPAGVLGSGEEQLAVFVRAAKQGGECADLEATYGIRAGSFSPQLPVLHSSSFEFALLSNGVPIRTKVGCNQACSYCTDPMIDGRRIHGLGLSMLDQLRVVRQRFPKAKNIFITDSEFNLPVSWAHDVAQSLADCDEARGFSFATQVLPKPFSRDLAGLLSRAGFTHLLVTADGFSDEVHKRNRKSYRTCDILKFIEHCHEHQIIVVLQNVFGLPGETQETLRHTLNCLKQYIVASDKTVVEFTLGGRIYPGTYLEAVAKREPHNVFGEVSDGLLRPLFYSAPYHPRELAKLVEDSLDVHLPSRALERDELLSWRTATTYYADTGDWKNLADTLVSAPFNALSLGLAEDVQCAASYSLEKAGDAVVPYLRAKLAGAPPSDAMAPFREYVARLNTETV
jgi:hypothetical protein